jgi:threonine dehydrogenase-like Zn-dependent dehydrogenase
MVKAFVIPGRETGAVDDVADPIAGPGEALINVRRAGICGTDVWIFRRDAAQASAGRTHYPLRPGHEWCGQVVAVGPDVPADWLGRRVVGDTMIGCGHCHRCSDGRHHVCEERYEVGVRGDWPGALAEKMVLPVRSLYAVPESVSDDAGAMVEPGANACRAVDAAALTPGARVLIAGPGTIGLLCTLFALAAGAEVHVLGLDQPALALATRLGAHGAWTDATLPELPWDAVINATYDATIPQRAVDLVEPGRRVVFIGAGHGDSPVDSRTLVGKDVTAVGILGGSRALAATIDAYADGTVDPTPLIARTIGLDGVAAALAVPNLVPLEGRPKSLVDPHRPLAPRQPERQMSQ